jgi:tetratricopeptide (TPR) repeat protein
VLTVFSGCSNLVQVRHHLRNSEQFVRAGDFDDALSENEQALLLAGDRPPSDQALFNIALIYANQDNPKRNSQRALEYFDRLASSYPDSTYTQIARACRSLVEKNQKLTRELAKRRVMLKRARDDNHRISELLEEHNVAIEKSENEKRKLNEELEKLNQMISESKRVDIEIEAKKRRATQ